MPGPPHRITGLSSGTCAYTPGLQKTLKAVQRELLRAPRVSCRDRAKGAKPKYFIQATCFGQLKSEDFQLK